MGRWVLIVIMCLFGLGVFSQNPKIDSLQAVLISSQGEKRIEVLQTLIINLWLNHPDTAMQYAREAYRLSLQLKNLRSQAISIRLMGGVCSYQGAYDSALYFSKWAHALSVKTNDSTLISSTLNNIGFAYYHLGSYGLALENLLRSLNMKYKIKQDYGLGQTLNNVGLVYVKLKDFTTARKYYNEAIAVAERTKDNNIKLYSNNNLGFSYLDQGNFSVAESKFKLSLEIAKSVSNTNWHATAYSGLGQVYYMRGLVDRARRQFKTSLALRNEIGDKKGISEIYYYLSKMYAASGYTDSAFLNLNISHRIANQIKSKERLLQNFDFYKELYSQQKQYDSALYYQTKFIDLRENLFNENLARNLADIELRISDEQNIQRLAAKDLQIQKRTMQSYFLVVLALFIFVFAVIVYWYYKMQKRLGLDLTKKNQEIVSQNEEIESQKETLELNNEELERAHGIIKDQNLKLGQLNDKLQSTVDIRTKELELANQELRVANLELDNFIYKSSHDIKGPLVRLLGVCHVALLDIQDEKSREYFMMMHKTAKHINDIFDRLKVVSDVNSLEVSFERIYFSRLFEQVHIYLQNLSGYDSIKFELNYEEGLEFFSDSFLLKTIFHNMMENAVKFQNDSNQEHKLIKVSVTEKNSNLAVSFIDNGIGIREADMDHIFKMFSQAALGHQTVGLGLYIVKQCVSKLGGSINLVKNEQKLTEFEVILPMRKVKPH